MATTFQLGDITIHRIVEQQAAFAGLLDFLPDLTPELLAENRPWLATHAIDAEDRLVLCFQSFVVRTPHHTILVDSCIGNDKERPRASWNRKTDAVFMDGLAALGLGVGDIDFVMCTHLHADHVGWNTRLENGRWVPTFPNARYVFSEAELAFWTERNTAAPIACIEDSVLPIVASGRAELVRSDFALNDHVRLLSTPGHTIDHFSVQLGRGPTPGALVSGDLIHSPLQARYPEMSMMVDHDRAQAARTRRSFLETCCETRALCCFTHFPSPSAARVDRWGDGFRCDFVAD